MWLLSLALIEHLKTKWLLSPIKKQLIRTNKAGPNKKSLLTLPQLKIKKETLKKSLLIWTMAAVPKPQLLVSVNLSPLSKKVAQPPQATAPKSQTVPLVFSSLVVTSLTN